MSEAVPSGWGRRTITSLVVLLLSVLTVGVGTTAYAADTKPPQPVRSLLATGGSGKISLSWVNPTNADLAGVLLVRKTGTVAPVTPTDGVRVTRVVKPGKAYTDKLLDAATTYSYAAFAYDKAGNFARAVKVTARTARRPPSVVKLGGTLKADIKLTPKKAKLFLIDSTFTVPAGRVLTLGAGTKVKVRHGLNVAGTLRSTGTSTRRALMTSVFDDTVRGDTADTDGRPQDNLFDLDLRSGGVIALSRADIRFGHFTNYDLNTGDSGAVTVTNSAVVDSNVELRFHFNTTTARFTGNTITRSMFQLGSMARPVVRNNTFADSAALGYGRVPKSGVYLGDIDDLAGIGNNTATGTPAQQLFQFESSSVRTSWTLQPGYVYGLGDITVKPSGTLTMGAGSLAKGNGTAIHVKGTLAATGTAEQPAVLTSLEDDTIGGDSNGDGAPADSANPYPYDISLEAGGSVQLDRAELHRGRLWNYDLNTGDSGAVTVTNSAVVDSNVELRFHFNTTTARFTGNTITRSMFQLGSMARPVVRNNTFADSAALGYGRVPKSGVYLGDIDDLAGIGNNTATGTPAQQLFQFESSSVRTSWTLQPGYVYGLGDITVDSGATMTATSGTEAKGFGTLDVVDGGTLSATRTTFDGAGGDIQVRPGGTADITLSTLSVPLSANVGWSDGLQAADVSVTYSTASEVYNLPKDWPGLSAVDGTGSVIAIVSSHTHTCVPPNNSTLPLFFRTLYDVEGTGRTDDPECPDAYTEVSGHP